MHIRPKLQTRTSEVDPDGKDVILDITRDKNGKITGVSVRATVYITGSGASEKRASELTKAAAKEFKGGTSNGASISFNVTYEYAKDIKKDDLKAGENLLTFSSAPEMKAGENSSNRSFVANDRKDENHQPVGGDYFGTVFSSGADDRTVLHEAGHLLGLDDQYLDITKGARVLDPYWMYHTEDYAKGYENDLMGGGRGFNSAAYVQDFFNVSSTASDMFFIAPSMDTNLDQHSHIPYSGFVNENQTTHTSYNWPPDSATTN